MRLALLQSNPVAGIDAGYAALENAAKGARAQGAELLVTPEMFLSGYNIPVSEIEAAAEALDQDRISAIARTHDIALLVGLPIRGKEGTFNTILFVDAEGEERARYKKTHLFGALDRERFVAGAQLSPIFEWQGWKIGLAICYDIEFPEVARKLTLEGAELLLVPTANMEPYHSVCTRVVPVRAEENTVFIAYANQVGREGDITYCGQSCLCGPDGEDLARAGRDATLLLADIALDRLDAARRAQTYLRDRCPDLY